MRLLRLALPALAFVAVGAWASPGAACDDSKTSASAASSKKSSACTAAMAAQCTAEQAASCHAKGTTATTASTASCTNKTSAAAYASSSNASCAAKTTAVTASSSGSSSCAAHGTKTTAIAAGSGSCNGRGMTTAAGKSSHGDCDACADMALCYEELEAAGTRTQIVPLKNGVMFVYTADNPGRVNLVQTAMARRNDRLAQIVTAGDKAHLCPECKSIRGAMASGKMTREVVNIEGGALTLMTSSDPAVVAKIHAMVENHKATRSKI